jgi:hypothetical protein
MHLATFMDVVATNVGLPLPTEGTADKNAFFLFIILYLTNKTARHNT